MLFTYRKFLRSSLIFNMSCSRVRTLFLCWITFYFRISCVITSIFIYSVVTHYFFIRNKLYLYPCQYLFSLNFYFYFYYCYSIFLLLLFLACSIRLFLFIETNIFKLPDDAIGIIY